MEFNVGDIVQLIDRRNKQTGQTGQLGRLDYLKQYEVLKITKEGHILIQTKWGKTHYSVNLFKRVIYDRQPH